VIDIDLVNAGSVYRRNGPGYRVFANALRENFATLGRQKLRIAQPANAITGIKYHGGGDHWPEKRSATNFVDSGYQLRPCGPRHLFIFQRAAQSSEQAQLCRRRGELLFRTGFSSRGHRYRDIDSAGLVGARGNVESGRGLS
jgi:hypothetical protein